MEPPKEIGDQAARQVIHQHGVRLKQRRFIFIRGYFPPFRSNGKIYPRVGKNIIWFILRHLNCQADHLARLVHINHRVFLHRENNDVAIQPHCTVWKVYRLHSC